jgi:uncharacterized membrane protein
MSTYVRTPPTAAWPVRLSVAGGAALTLAATAGALTGRPPRLDLIGEASPAIQIHLAAVVVALGVGAWQLLGPKGTTAHRLLGWTWTLAMMAAALSSFFIRTILGGWFSPIHLLSALTLVSLPVAIWAAHRHDVRRHARIMTRVYLAGLVVAGGFAFMPGRLLWRVFFG